MDQSKDIWQHGGADLCHGGGAGSGHGGQQGDGHLNMRYDPCERRSGGEGGEGSLHKDVQHVELLHV